MSLSIRHVGQLLDGLDEATANPLRHRPLVVAISDMATRESVNLSEWESEVGFGEDVYLPKIGFSEHFMSVIVSQPGFVLTYCMGPTCLHYYLRVFIRHFLDYGVKQKSTSKQRERLAQQVMEFCDGKMNWRELMADAKLQDRQEQPGSRLGR
jgi:hypothetical protein